MRRDTYRERRSGDGARIFANSPLPVRFDVPMIMLWSEVIVEFHSSSTRRFLQVCTYIYVNIMIVRYLLRYLRFAFAILVGDIVAQRESSKSIASALLEIFSCACEMSSPVPRFCARAQLASTTWRPAPARRLLVVIAFSTHVDARLLSIVNLCANLFQIESRAAQDRTTSCRRRGFFLGDGFPEIYRGHRRSEF